MSRKITDKACLCVFTVNTIFASEW